MESKNQERTIAENARKIAIDYIRNKYRSTDTEYILNLFESGGELTGNLKKEYEEKYDEVIKKFESQNNDAQNLKKELEQKNKSIEELTDTLKRLQAEFENYKKRVDKEKGEFVKYAHADVVANMLPLLDSFEIALKNTNDSQKFIEGVKIIYAQIYSVLEYEGLKPIEAVGKQFDPYKHEVLMKEESDKPEGTILEEFQKGYMLNDKVLRHSKVKVSGK